MALIEGVTTIQVFHAGGQAPASIGEAYNLEAGNPKGEMVALSGLFAAIGSGVRPARVVVSTDSCTGASASITSAITGASVVAGEYIAVMEASGRVWKVTGVASGSVSGDGTFVVSGTSNTAATNVRAAFNTLPGFSDVAVLSGSTNSLVFTATQPGTVGNTLTLIDGTGGGITPVGAFAGGLDSSALRTASVAITHANVTNADTVTIGTVVITAQTAANIVGGWTIGANATADAVAMAAAINAHPSLTGRISASTPVAGTVTLTYLADAGGALLVGLSTSDATAFALTAFAAGVTYAGVVAPRTYSLGAP